MPANGDGGAARRAARPCAAPAGRRALLALLGAAAAQSGGRPAAPAAAQARFVPAAPDSPEGAALLARLRAGGLVLFFRHADTRGEPCDRSFRVGDRAGQRNLSPLGRAQAARIGAALARLGVPVGWPVLAGPVFRARDTAELAFDATQELAFGETQRAFDETQRAFDETQRAFDETQRAFGETQRAFGATPPAAGRPRVEVTDSLLADDYAGGRLAWVLAEHRRLFSAPVPAGTNRVLVGHRTPAIMVAGEAVGGRAFPEGAALVIAPRGAGFDALGILELAPLPGGGFHGCG